MDLWLPSVPLTLALATVATLGYLVGRRAQQAQRPVENDARRELRRASVVAKELESIAVELRKSLAAHHASVSRFQERVATLTGDQQATAWIELCREAEDMLKPTMKLASQLAQAYDEIRQQSNQLMSFTEVRTDPLTGVSNRRALDESLRMMFAVMARYDQAFSLAIFDIDHFKKINDEHGHVYGDRMLRDVAKAIDDTARETDVVTRYGGEEFVVVMPHTSLDGAVTFAERVRRQIAESLKLTVSGGVTHALDGDTPASLLTRADEALYGAKAGGRNRVCYHNGDQVLPVETPRAELVAL